MPEYPSLNVFIVLYIIIYLATTTALNFYLKIRVKKHGWKAAALASVQSSVSGLVGIAAGYWVLKQYFHF